VAADDYSIKVKIVLEDFERKLVDSIKKIQPIVKETFLGVLDTFALKLSVLLSNVKNEANEIMEMMRDREHEEETFLGKMTKRLVEEIDIVAPAVKFVPEEVEAARIVPTTVKETEVTRIVPFMAGTAGEDAGVGGGTGAGGGAGAAGAAGIAGAAGAAPALAVVAIQSLISIIKQVMDYLKRVSAVLSAMFKLIETSIILLIKPIADFIGYILKPIVMLLLRFFILPFYRTIAPKIKEIGDLWDKIFMQIMTPLMPILTDAAETIARVLPYTLPMLIPAIVGVAMLIASPIILISLIVKQLKDFANWILNGILWLLKTVEGFAKWLQGGWSWVVNSVLVPFWNAVQGFFSWMVSGWNWLANNVLIPIVNFLKSIAVKGLFGLFGFQWGGEIQKTGLYRLHAGERVVSAGEMAQTVFVYPRIDIGSVNLGSEKDLSRLEERINKAIADALRRRR